MQRFYGGNKDWLNIPFWELKYYHTMLAILQAEETRNLLNIAMCGSGNAKSEDVNKFISRINNIASARDQKKPTVSPEMKNAVLSSLGMGVIDMKDKSIPEGQRKKLFPFNPTETKD